MVFPIHKNELRKFIPLSLIFFCISYNQSLLRGIKDMLILIDGETSTLYYLKLFCVMPALIIFAIVYGNLSTKFNREGRFYIILIYFILFFSIFLIFILPNQETFKLTKFTSNLFISYPKLSGFWEIIKNWHFSLFYIHAEAWGSYALGIAFWTLANDITNINQSKRFYSILSISSNIGGIIAGLSLSYFFKGNYKISLVIAILLMFISIIIFKILSRDIRQNPLLYELDDNEKRAKKLKLSFIESIKHLINSKYLMLIAFIVISYGICISLFEAIWKNNLKIYSLGDKDYLASIYGQQMYYIGITSILLSIFLFPTILKKGWRLMAYFTPISFLFSSLVFFSFCFFQNKILIISNFLNTTPLGLSIVIGLVNVIFIKACKYSFFDTSKESAYIPLDEESKVRSKAAVDGVSLVFGKGLGAILVTVLSIIVGNGIDGIKYILAFFILLFLILWMFGINSLYKKFKKLGGDLRG
ncbi:MAG: ADP/ATP carrier protein [Bacteroidetes bacterium]|nr:ADP/ATP carrier protein [Bacteroidota bacterium]